MWWLLLACADTGHLEVPDPVLRLHARLDADGDGLLRLDELAAREPEHAMEVVDADGDGGISVEELRAHVYGATRLRPESLKGKAADMEGKVGKEGGAPKGGHRRVRKPGDPLRPTRPHRDKEQDPPGAPREEPPPPK